MKPPVADTLEARIWPVNQSPALRKPTYSSKTGKGVRLNQTEDQVRKNMEEKSGRDLERFHLERISRLFKVPHLEKTWTRVGVLSFGKILSPTNTF
jgi:hypothetical protein